MVSSLTLEFVRVPVAATKSGVAYDPSADVVSLAFVPRGVDPQAADRHQGSWEPSGDPSHPFSARILVGPGGVVQLAAGTYSVWVKIADNPEVPVLRAGIVEVT